jgi:4'-phosphopantetheinyl transferase
MIHWLVQSLADHPDLARGVPPPGLLSPKESARLAGLRIAKRRRDWLLGRWTAKQLLQSTLGREFGLSLPLSAYTIDNDAMGAPLAEFDPGSAGREAAEGGAAGFGGVSLSISHSGSQAFCALSLHYGARVGADIECIEERSLAFVHDYFTTDEITDIATTPAGLQPALTTLIWSAKEATLKALRLGLRADTRQVSCPILLDAIGADDVPPEYRWSKFAVEVDPALWAQAGLNGPAQWHTVSGWWQIMGNYALTLVLIS